MTLRVFIRTWLIALAALLLTLPTLAQSNRQLEYGAVVQGNFGDESPAPHIWQFEGDSRDIIALTVRRIGGQFTPRLSVRAPDGTTLSPTAEIPDDHSQYAIFRQGLPANGTYEVQINEENTASDTLLNISAYTLELQQFGQRRANSAEGLTELPDTGTAPLPDYFSGSSRVDADLGVDLYGDGVSVRQPDARTERFRFIIRGSGRSVDLRNANPISRGIEAFSFRENGIAFRHTERGGEGVFFTDQDITAFTHEQGYTELTLENGQSFRLDFYRLDTILAVDGLVAVLTDDGQRWLLDGQAFELVRRGGLNGEGINAEPVNLLRIDTTEIQTDLQVWDTLAYLEQNGSRQLRVLYGTDFRFISGRGNVDLFQRGNSLRPELDNEGTDTSYAEITWRREENPLSLAIDPEGMGDIRLDAATLRVMPLDGRDLSESVENIDSLLIEEADVRFVRFDGSYRTSLLDTTDIETPAEIVIEQGLSPFAENFTPQEFNNTGVQLYDYSPDVVPYQALMPYNRVNGNFYYEVTDAHVPGHTLELQWTRHYNSLAPGNQTPAYMRQVRYRAGQIGNQWRHSYQYELDVRLAPLGEMRLILPDGSVHRFRNTEANPARFRSATLNAWQIDRQDGLLGTWTATTGDGTRYRFDEAGRLQRIIDTDNLALLFSPAPPDADTGATGGFFVTEPYGRRFSIATDDSNRVIQLQDVQGRTLSYSYEDNRLTGVDYIAADQQASYAYSDAGLLNQVDDSASPYHQQIALSYDAQQRVTGYTENPDALNDAPPRQVTLSYPEAGVVLENHLVNGEQREHRWLHDTAFRLTEEQLPREEWSNRFVYDTTSGRLNGYTAPNRTTMNFTLNNFGYIDNARDPVYAGTDSYSFEYDSPDGYRQLLQRMVYPIRSNRVREITFSYDEAYRLQQVTRPFSTEADPDGRREEVLAYTYDEWGRLTSRTAPGTTSAGNSGEVITYTYDSFGYLASVQRGDDVPVRFQYDIVGRLVSVTGQRDTTLSIQWDTDREQITRITAGDVTREYDYDTVGNLIRFREQDTDIEYIYNGLNQVTSVIDSIGRVTTYDYDEAGNVLRVILPNDTTREYTYNALNQLTRAVDTGGLETTYNITLNTDSNRVIQTITNPAGEQQRYTYDAIDRLRQVQYLDRNGNGSYTYNLNYDALGYLTEIQEAHVPGGRTLRLTYDVNGNIRSSSIDGTTTRYTYDTSNRLVSVTHPNEQTVRYAYDGNQMRVTAADGAESLYEYDADDNLVRFVNALEQEYLYTYNEQNRLTSAQDSAGNLTTFEYDANGNLIAVTDPRNNRSSAEYDAANRLQQVEDADGSVTYQYDVLDRLTRIERPLGLTLNLTYDRRDNLIAVALPRGREVLYGRDNLGRISNQTDALGRITIYAYNTIGEVGRLIDPLGNAATYGWSSSGRLLSYIDTAGHQYEYNADDIGRLQSINDRALEQNLAINLRLSYDESGYITAIQRGSSRFIGGNRGINHTYEYDAAGRIIRYQEPESDVPWAFEYDALGQMTAVTRPDGIITRYTYDEIGNITDVVHAAGTETETIEQYGYDETGNVTAYTAPGGLQSSFIYDENNRVTQRTETTPDGEERVTFFRYNALGYLQEITDASGQRTRYQYDIFGNLERVERQLLSDDDSGESVETPIRYTYRYDEVDNLTGIQLPGGQDINLTYNVLDERVRYVDPMDRVWSYTYDDAGNLSQINDPAGSLLVYTYDSANRLIQIRYPTGAIVDVRYDENGNPNEFIQPATRAGDVTQRENSRERLGYVLDREGRLLRIERPNGTVEFQRDNMGRVTQRRAADGSTTRYSYNEQGNMTAVQRPDETINRTYDNAGRLLSRSGSDGTTTYTYDDFGNLSELQTPDATLSYEYDAVGNLLVRDAGEYGRIEYTYDSLYRPVRVTIDGEAIDITYNENGWRTRLERENGLATLYSYNDNGYIESITHTGADGARLDSFAYLYDSVGNISRITRGDLWSVLYSYDAAHQLTSERWLNPDNQAVYSVTYSYDNAGNRVEKLEQVNLADVERTLYTYNNQNQLTEEIQNAIFNVEDRLFLVPLFLIVLPGLWWLSRRRRRYLSAMVALPLIIMPVFQQQQSQPDPAVLYEYDSNGNLAAMDYTEVGGAMSFDYDGANRLNTVSGQRADGAPVNTAIRYDSAGRVYEITRDDTTYRYIYDAHDLMAIRNLSDGSLIRLHSPLDNQVLRIDTPDGTRWLLHDALGTVRKMTSASGELINNGQTGYNLNAFGEWIEPYGRDEAYSRPAVPQPLYVGQMYLPESRLYLMGVRSYLPRMGRFIQRDPVRHDPRGTLYTYAYNRPGVYTDPDGMVPQQAYTGLEEQPPDVAVQTAVPAPLLPNVPRPPAVHVLQAMENHRILRAGHDARYQMNSITGQMAPTYCDFYMYLAHPVPDTVRNQVAQPLENMVTRFDASRGWIPAREPDPRTRTSALNRLDTFEQMLRNAQTGRPLQGCDTPLRLPQQPQPLSALQTGQQQMQFAETLREVPMFGIMPEQLDILQREDAVLSVNELPRVVTQRIQPQSRPGLPSSLQSLIDQTHTFYQTDLLTGARLTSRDTPAQVDNQPESVYESVQP